MRRVAALLVAMLVLAPVPGGADVVHPTIYAHRGGAGIAPENTLGAFRHTVELYGARGVWLELDVQLAADGVLVVIHDATVDRTTDCSGRVVGFTSSALQACDARGGWPSWPSFEPVPTFRAVLDEAKANGWRLMPEIKNIPGEPNFDPTGIAAADALIADVRASGIDAAVVAVQSFFPTSLDRIELRAPEIATALLTTSQLPGAPDGVGFTVGENVAFAVARGYEHSLPDHESVDLTAEMVGAAHLLGQPIVVWTVNTAARMSALSAIGVDGIITDRPDIAYDTLG